MSLGSTFEAWLHHKNVGFLQQDTPAKSEEQPPLAPASSPLQPYLLPSPLMDLGALCELW